MNENKSNKDIVRKKYSSQFKDQALERAKRDEVPQVAKDLGIAESSCITGAVRKSKVATPLKTRQTADSDTQNRSTCHRTFGVTLKNIEWCEMWHEYRVFKFGYTELPSWL